MPIAGVGVQEPAGGLGWGMGGTSGGRHRLKNTWVSVPMGPGRWGVSRRSRCEGPPAGSSPDMSCCPVVLVPRGGDSDPRPAFISQPGPHHGHRSCPRGLVWAALSVQTCPCVSTPSSMKPSQPVLLQLHGGQNRPLCPLGQCGHRGSTQGGGIQQRVQVPLRPQGSWPKAQSMPTVPPPKVPALVTAPCTLTETTAPKPRVQDPTVRGHPLGDRASACRRLMG